MSSKYQFAGAIFAEDMDRRLFGKSHFQKIAAKVNICKEKQKFMS